MPISPALRILGIPIHDVTLEEAVEQAAAWVREGGVHQMATVNPEFVMAAQRDPAFRAVLERADLCLPDGVGITLAARYLGRPLRERVAGVDLVETLAARAARDGWRLFFLGAAPGVADRAASILAARYPGLTVAGTYAGSPRREEEQEIIQRVRGAGTDVLLVAYGAPAQDLWLARNLARTGAKVGVGVGGSFDYIAGIVPRAPRWIRRVGLEWLYRLIRQPWRWRRQRVLPLYAIRVILSRGKT